MSDIYYSRKPTKDHLAFWNTYITLPPGIVYEQLAQGLTSLREFNLDMDPVIEIRLEDSKEPQFIFEIWPRYVAHKNRNARHVKQRVLRASRLFKDEHVYASWSMVNKAFPLQNGLVVNLQKHGLMRRLFANAMPLFAKMGYSRYKAYANSRYGNAGAYVWPKFGLIPTEKTWNALRIKLAKKLEQIIASQKKQKRPLSDKVIARLSAALRSSDPRKLWVVVDTGYSIDDPDNQKARVALGEYLMRDERFGGYHDFQDRQWQRRFYSYVGIDTRPSLDARLKPANKAIDRAMQNITDCFGDVAINETRDRVTNFRKNIEMLAAGWRKYQPSPQDIKQDLIDMRMALDNIRTELAKDNSSGKRVALESINTSLTAIFSKIAKHTDIDLTQSTKKDLRKNAHNVARKLAPKAL